MQHAAQVGDLECLAELVAHRRAADVRAAHICTRTCLTPLHPGLGSPLPHLHRDWAHPCPDLLWVPVQMWAGASPVPAQMWAGGEPSPSADVVGWARSRRRCGQGGHGSQAPRLPIGPAPWMISHGHSGYSGYSQGTLSNHRVL